MDKRLPYALLSIALLSIGWLGITGLGLLAALVPLLWISGKLGATKKEAWAMLRWCALVFGGWAVATTWWIWIAAPIGAILSVIISIVLCGGAFMLYHYVSKRAPKSLAYTTLVAAWIAAEYLYMQGELSFPWLALGNGLAHDIRAVQWYELTGIFGGSLWILLCNIAFYERKWVVAAALVVLPLGGSLARYSTYEMPDRGAVEVAVVQPNLDPYVVPYTLSSRQQVEVLGELMRQAPQEARFIIAHEVVLPDEIYEHELGEAWQVEALRGVLRDRPAATLIAGATTLAGGERFNTALAIDTSSNVQLRHKSLLVVGAEKTPFNSAFDFLNVPVGRIMGQLGSDPTARVFRADSLVYATAICYEGLYGGYMAQFARGGARAIFIISNDGWWGDTPGYRQLFAYACLRAVELRRAIARSANTGRSGIISPRGEVVETLGWDERGVLAGALPLSDKLTFYARYGDFIARLACFTLALCVLYFLVLRARMRWR